MAEFIWFDSLIPLLCGCLSLFHASCLWLLLHVYCCVQAQIQGTLGVQIQTRSSAETVGATCQSVLRLVLVAPATCLLLLTGADPDSGTVTTSRFPRWPTTQQKRTGCRLWSVISLRRGFFRTGGQCRGRRHYQCINSLLLPQCSVLQ